MLPSGASNTVALLRIDHQVESLTRLHQLLHELQVVLPQAIRLTIPPLTNRTIVITKSTAVASVVAVQEILGEALAAQGFAANTTPLTMAAIAYLLIFLPLVVLSRWVETRFAWKR